MRSARWVWMSAGLVVTSGATFGPACVSLKDDCALTATCPVEPKGDAGPLDSGDAAPPPDPDCQEAPMNRDGGPLAKCGVYATPTASADGDGSLGKPFASLQEAVDFAATTGDKNVYACAKQFNEALRVPSGVSLFGGLDCDQNWAWTAGARTVVKSPAGATVAGASEIGARLVAGLGATVLSDVDIVAPDGALPGVSSIGMLIEDTQAVLSRVTLTAGKGADGAMGTHILPSADLDGVDGVRGLDICVANSLSNPGQAGGKKMCGGVDVSGGAGGDGGLFSSAPATPLGAGNGGNGSPLTAVDAGVTGGAGGAGEPVGASTCGGGTPGLPGTPGKPGAGATTMGVLTSSGYSGESGRDGSDGTPGQGAGGGGGAKGQLSVTCGTVPGARFGASGGGGGSGACGGAKGGGGQAGGASIALATLTEKAVILTAVTLVVGSGGKGGAGGDGQSGGNGGRGKGGGDAVPGSTAACNGADGGPGGVGGPGGGGHGGPAVGVAYKGAIPGGESPTFDGTAAAGGPGGAPGTNSTEPSGGQGANGAVVAALPF